MKPILSLAGALALLAALPAAGEEAPRSPAGDWHGAVAARSGPVRSAIHIEETGPAVFAGDIDLPDSGVWNAPLDQVTYKDGVLAYAYRGGTRGFEGRWDATAGAWVGRFRTPGGSSDLAYRAGFLGLPRIDGIDGRWEGVLRQNGVEGRVVVRIVTDPHGTHALMDLPHLAEVDIPLGELARSGATVTASAPSMGARFDLNLDEQGRVMTGVLRSAAGDVPVELTRSGKGGPRRAQTPRPPFPYAAEELTLTVESGVRLGCTLTRPATRGPHPAALLLTGSGQQDRDETVVGHRPFLVIADHLTRRGVAVLRCDDRGAGASTGSFNAATLETFAADAVAGVEALRARPDIRGDAIGLIGHSEGGIVASMVAARRSDVAFVVQIAGPGVAVYDLLLAQAKAAARAQGAPEAVINEQDALRQSIFRAMRSAATPQEAQAAAEAVMVQAGRSREAARAEAAYAVNPNIWRIFAADPAALLARVTVPVLAMVGSRDVQVPPAQNLPGLRAALAGNRDASVVELAGLNHMLQTAPTGAVAEYYDLEETVAPLALETLTRWLQDRGLAGVP